MEINGKSYGTTVEGGWLLRHGKAPRDNPKDRHQRYWFECTLCGTFKAIRATRVHGGKTGTRSCGCHGRKQFVDLHESLAGKIGPRLRLKIWRMVRGRRRKTSETIALMFKLTKYCVNFIVAAHCRLLRAVANLRQNARTKQSQQEAVAGYCLDEQQWIRDYESNAENLAQYAARKAWDTAHPIEAAAQRAYSQAYWEAIEDMRKAEEARLRALFNAPYDGPDYTDPSDPNPF